MRERIFTIADGLLQYIIFLPFPATGKAINGRLVQEPERPKRNLPEDCALDVVGRHVTLLFTLYLAESLVLSADFDNDIPVDLEVTGRDAAVFHAVAGAGELAAEETLAQRPDFRFHGGCRSGSGCQEGSCPASEGQR